MTLNKNRERVRINKPIIISFLISFIIFMIYCTIKNNRTFYYDSIDYWRLSSTFQSNGKFSLTKYFPQAIRGYFLPFLLFVFQKIGLIIFKNGFVGLWILNSMSFSAILVILLDIFLKKNSITIRKTIISSIIYSLLIIFFYKGMLIYPLSDNIAIMLFLAAIFFSIKQFKNDLANNIKYTFIGCFLYGCYNTRPTYLIPIIIFIFILAISNTKNKWNFASNIILMFLGVIIIALPQMIINKTYLQIYSPLIIFSIGGSKNLNLLQLYSGLGCNSYETVIAPVNNYPAIPGLVSINRTGEIIKSIENITPGNMSYLTIIKLIFKYPFEMIGIYFTHLVNILFIFDEDCYVKDMSRNLSMNFFVSFIIIYLNGLFLSTFKDEKILQTKEKGNFLREIKNIDKGYALFFIPAISAVLTIPGQIETRFFIYIHIVMYFIVCFAIDYNKLFVLMKKRFVKIAISFLFLIGIFSSISSYNLASKPSEGLTFSLNPYAINIEKKINEQRKQNLMPYVPQSEVYQNGYLPPDFSFITKTAKSGEISFSITFNKNITESNKLCIYINGNLVNTTSDIKKSTYDFKFEVEPNKINYVQIQSSFSYNDELNRKSSFKLDNLKVN